MFLKYQSFFKKIWTNNLNTVKVEWMNNLNIVKIDPNSLHLLKIVEFPFITHVYD